MWLRSSLEIYKSKQPNTHSGTFFISLFLFYTIFDTYFLILSDPTLYLASVKQGKFQSAYYWPAEGLWLGATASCKTVDLFCWTVHVPTIPHQRPSVWHGEDHTPDIGHAWHQRLSQIGVVRSINIRMEALEQILFPQDTIWKPVAWTAGNFWQRWWPHFWLRPVGVNWTRQLDQSAMDGWPWQHSVNNTGSCYRKPSKLEKPVAN